MPYVNALRDPLEFRREIERQSEAALMLYAEVFGARKLKGLH